MKKLEKLEKPIYVTRSSMPKYEDYCNMIKPLWESRHLTNCGSMHSQFEGLLQNKIGSSNIELFSNGHLSLEIAIKSLELKGEVITTPFTFASTTNAIVNCGLKPVFCDIDPETYNIDPKNIEGLITEKTSAIIAVHVFGTPCDVTSLYEIAKKHGLKLIFDAAHAFGVEVDGRSVGLFGDISMFSLHATKVFNSIEGGFLSFADSSLKGKLKAARNFGLQADGDIMDSGINAKMNEFQAAMGICNLKDIDENIEKRKAISEIYSKIFTESDKIKLLKEDPRVKRNYSYYPIVLSDKSGISRDLLMEKLNDLNIFARKYFYPLCSDFSYAREYKIPTPVASRISDNVIALPLYADMEKEVAEYIANIIVELLADR